MTDIKERLTDTDATIMCDTFKQCVQDSTLMNPAMTRAKQLLLDAVNQEHEQNDKIDEKIKILLSMVKYLCQLDMEECQYIINKLTQGEDDLDNGTELLAIIVGFRMGLLSRRQT